MLSPVSECPALDRCPSLARPFRADDGALLRVRVPGGRLSVATIADLLGIATDHGAPVLQLTSRGNLQLRALPDPFPRSLTTRLESTGLFPSTSHEQARNIIASPADADIRRLVQELDAALVAAPELAGLPGRFLFAVSTAGGAVLREPWDLAYEDAVAEILHRARLFLAHRAGERIWNLADLPLDSSPVVAGMSPYVVSPAEPLLPGVVENTLVAGVPLGLLRARHVSALSFVTDVVTLTPWRSLVIDGGAAHEASMAAAGFVTAASSPWSRLSACVGAPSCRRTSSRTLDLTSAAAARVSTVGPRVHVVGCERRCGHPTGDHLTVLDPRSVDDVLAVAGTTP